MADFLNDIRAESVPLLMVAFVYLCLSSLTVMNMLIGVLCEVITGVSADENEAMMIDKVNEQFGDIVKELDFNKNGSISWAEFGQIMFFPGAVKALVSMNVDPESMVDIAEDFFFDDGVPVELTFEEFMLAVLDLRGGRQPTMKDKLESVVIKLDDMLTRRQVMPFCE